MIPFSVCVCVCVCVCVGVFACVGVCACVCVRVYITCLALQLCYTSLTVNLRRNSTKLTNCLVNNSWYKGLKRRRPVSGTAVIPDRPYDVNGAESTPLRTLSEKESTTRRVDESRDTYRLLL